MRGGRWRGWNRRPLVCQPMLDKLPKDLPRKITNALIEAKPGLEEMKGALYTDNHRVYLHSKLLGWLL